MLKSSSWRIWPWRAVQHSSPWPAVFTALTCACACVDVWVDLSTGSNTEVFVIDGFACVWTDVVTAAVQQLQCGVWFSFFLHIWGENDVWKWIIVVQRRKEVTELESMVLQSALNSRLWMKTWNVFQLFSVQCYTKWKSLPESRIISGAWWWQRRNEWRWSQTN